MSLWAWERRARKGHSTLPWAERAVDHHDRPRKRRANASLVARGPLAKVEALKAASSREMSR